MISSGESEYDVFDNKSSYLLVTLDSASGLFLQQEY